MCGIFWGILFPVIEGEGKQWAELSVKELLWNRKIFGFFVLAGKKKKKTTTTKPSNVCWIKFSWYAKYIGFTFCNVLSLLLFGFPTSAGFSCVVFPCQPGSPQEKPKRLRLVVDVSGSMYRFNGVDGRLERSMEAVCMVMEAFENYEHKFKVIAAGLGALWLLHGAVWAVEKVFQQSVWPKSIIHSHKEIKTLIYF